MESETEEPARQSRRRDAGSDTSQRGEYLSDKRIAILDAAVDVFVEHGYELTSLDAIATRAGVSKQTIYNNFGDKRRLFDVAINRARLSADTSIEPSDDLSRDPDLLLDDLTTIGQEFLRVALAPRVSATRRLIIGEAGRRPELQDACADTPALAGPRVVGWLTVQFRMLTSEGVLDVDDPDKVARQFFGLLLHEGLAASGYGTRTLPPRLGERMSRQTAQLVLRAYGHRQHHETRGDGEQRRSG